MTALILEEQPDFLDGVPVVLDLPEHRLAVALRAEVQLIPGERMRSVKLVRSFRVAWISCFGVVPQGGAGEQQVWE